MQLCMNGCSLVVRIWRSHRHGRGSIPGMGITKPVPILMTHKGDNKALITFDSLNRNIVYYYWRVEQFVFYINRGCNKHVVRFFLG